MIQASANVDMVTPSPRALAIISATLVKEGGFVDLADDRGGPTNYGWSLRTLIADGKIDPAFAHEADINGDGKLDIIDVKGMTRAFAINAYDEWFFRRPGFDTLPQPFDAALFDQGVWGGTSSAVVVLQRALNAVFRTYLGLEQLALDGALGPTTRARLALATASTLGASTALTAFRKAASERVIAIVAADPTQREFLAGWLKRADELGDV